MTQEAPESETAELETEHCCITNGVATGDGRARQIASGVWSVFAIHQPPVGALLPNRLLIYEVKDAAGKATLVVVNGITPDLVLDEPFGAIRRLARERDAQVGYIFNPGPEHHLSLGHYAKAFPDARVVVAAGRIQRENPTLCALDNVETIPAGDVLPELAALGFHVHVWDGLMEGTLSNLSQLRFNAPRGTAEPVLFFHEQSATLLNGGHGWWYWGEKVALPWPARKLLGLVEGEVTWSSRHYTCFDAERCAASAARVLEWGFDTLLDLHTPKDVWLKTGAHAAAKRLCDPMIEGRWGDLPFKQEALQIPEGTVTGGDWKSYR
jgi:hypothetical protein